MDNFFTVSHPTPLRNARQILAEINRICDALKEAQYNLLENYVGLDKKQILAIKDIESRWICIYNQTPSTLFYDKGVILTKNL